MTRWYAYHFKLVDAYRPIEKQEPYHCQAVCIDPPGHPRIVHAQGKTREDAKLKMIEQIKSVLADSEILEIR